MKNLIYNLHMFFFVLMISCRDKVDYINKNDTAGINLEIPYKEGQIVLYKPYIGEGYEVFLNEKYSIFFKMSSYEGSHEDVFRSCNIELIKTIISDSLYLINTRNKNNYIDEVYNRSVTTLNYEESDKLFSFSSYIGDSLLVFNSRRELIDSTCIFCTIEIKGKNIPFSDTMECLRIVKTAKFKEGGM